MAGPIHKEIVPHMKRSKHTLSYVALIILTTLIVFPVFWMLVTSIKTNIEIFAVPPKIFPAKPVFRPYLDIFTSDRDKTFFINSYLISIAVSMIALFLGSMAGYGFSRFRFRGSKPIKLFIIVTQMIPPVVIVIPYFALIVRLHLYDTILGLVITYLSFALPYSFLMMNSYYNTISTDIDEAAIMEGCGFFKIFYKIVSPAAIPGMISTFIYTFLLSWNEFLFALVLTRTMEKRTIPVGISLMIGELNTDWTAMMAMSVIGSVPVLLLYLILQRYFMSGFTAGSVKG